jgi:hypothetical protein
MGSLAAPARNVPRRDDGHGKHGGRGADQFGTLLAAAHMLLEDDPPDDRELVEWGSLLSAATLAEKGDDSSDAQKCVHHLGSTLVQLAGHGMPRLVAEWVAQAVKPASEGDDQAKAKEMLAKIGMGIFVGSARRREEGDRPAPVPGRTYIVVANSHQGLSRQFEGSHWAGKSGASGVWTQALVRIPGALRNERQRIAKMPMACTLVPVEAMLEPEPSLMHAAEMADA